MLSRKISKNSLYFKVIKTKFRIKKLCMNPIMGIYIIYVCKENELRKYSLKFKDNLNTQRNQCKGIEESRVNNDIFKGKWGNIFQCIQTQKTNICIFIVFFLVCKSRTMIIYITYIISSADPF